MNSKTKCIAKLMIIASLIMACQKGKKVESESTIYKDNLAVCDQTSNELKNEGIDLDSRKYNDFDRYTNLPHLSDNQKTETIQANLEKFVVAAQKLKNLADEKVVVFPDKSRINHELKIASYYLGEIYADTRWDAASQSLSSEVDFAELTYRMGRISKNLNIVKDAGFPYDGNVSKNFSLKKYKNAQLQKIADTSDQLMRDYARMNDLVDRNSGWKQEGLQIMGRSASAISSYYYVLCDSIKSELKNRRA